MTTRTMVAHFCYILKNKHCCDVSV